MNRSKQKGTAWESKVVGYLRECGWPFAERRALAGSLDKGDLTGIPGLCCEMKSAARIDLSGWLDEAEVERDNAGARIGVAWIKRRGHTSAGKGYVVMSGETFVQLLVEGGYQ